MMRLFFLLITFLVFFSSCKDTWDEDDKVLFKKACLDDANKWAGSSEKATTYCNCVLDKILVKYPNENDALEHLDSIIKDPGMRSCREQIR
jgi:hypothetical protein